MLPAPRRGGTGIIFILLNSDGNEETYQPPTSGYMGATNNQMELQACVEALRLATAQSPHFDPRRYHKIVIFSDSLYVADNYTTALFTWSKNGWTKRDGAPVDNAVQWKDLVRLVGKADRRGKRVEIRLGQGKEESANQGCRQARQENRQGGARPATDASPGAAQADDRGVGARQRRNGRPEAHDPHRQD